MHDWLACVAQKAQLHARKTYRLTGGGNKEAIPTLASPIRPIPTRMRPLNGPSRWRTYRRALCSLNNQLTTLDTPTVGVSCYIGPVGN